VINRPARDAMLLHHAIQDLSPNGSGDSPRGSRSDMNPRSSKSDVKESSSGKKERYELLISRLVRLHWDRLHFHRTKIEYRDKYGTYLEDDVEDCVKGQDFMDFCLELCESAN
jgi:hypothetical protein